MTDAFSPLRQPEDLSRLTIPAEVPYCIISLLRFLQASRPSFQEESWAVQATMAAAPGQWFEMRKSGVPTGYIQAEPSHGRYTSTPPERIDRSQIMPLELPVPPPTALRDFLSTMIERLAAQDPAAARDFELYPDALMKPEEETGYLSTREFTSALAGGNGLGVSDAAVMAELETALLDRFDRLRIRGEIVAIFLMLFATARQADPQRALTVALQSTPKAPVHDIVGFGDFVLSGVLAQQGGKDWIGAAAQELKDRIETKLDEATAARSIGQFYGAIYASVPLAYGAKRGFGFLARALAGDEAANYAVLANQCDERFAYAMAALKVDFANSMDWRILIDHRRMVERQRHLKGDAAAQAVAIELIDISMMYPGFFRPFLIGTTNKLTTKLT